MADRFTGAVKVALASRVGGRCSSPACGAITSGPAADPGRAVNVGVAAHITAASPGGARYDPALSAAERAGALNGIWLCQTCSHLIDCDEIRYSVQVLRRWKAEAEKRAGEMLAAGVGSAAASVELDVPLLESEDALLSFASPRFARVGRDGEQAELDAFLSAGQRFTWWLWTGPAGVGKSRLAVELCREVSEGWHAGFLREGSQDRLGDLQALQPTLVVVDYAAPRSAWLSDALLSLSRRDEGAPVRVLVLERAASGPWWETAQRLQRFEESRLLAASSYALPRELGGLTRAEACTLIREVAAQVGTTLTSTNVEDIADHAEHIDPSGRPLFVLVAAMDWLDGNGMSVGRDTALRRLVSRLDSQAAERLTSSLPLSQVRNIRAFGTALGGVTAERYDQILQHTAPPAGLLPGVFDDFQGLSLDELLDGVRPDILGELYVLDRLACEGVDRHATKTLLRFAWRTDQDAYHAFVERAVADHREHARVTDLLDAATGDESLVAYATLAADTVSLLERSDHPALAWIFNKLTTLPGAAHREDIDELVVKARFRFATLIYKEGGYLRANEMYTAVLADCDPAWPVHAGILNNRGITWLELERQDEAVADFTAVIEDPAATDESRACALNNRADIYHQDGDFDDAIADRTAVLELAETTYNRRFIALARRANALWQAGKQQDARLDIATILDTADIAMEQKMAARLQRALWLIDTGQPADARADLQAIVTSSRNFDVTEARARELLTSLDAQ